MEPLKSKKISVINVDIKKSAGVDIVADILHKEDRERVRNISFQNILCSNVLEHVLDVHLFCDALNNLLPEGGNLIVTVPYKYPYHEDPIDNMLRPTVEELSALFSKLKLSFGEILDCGTVKEYENYKKKIRPYEFFKNKIKSSIKEKISFFKTNEISKLRLNKQEFSSDTRYYVTCAIYRK